MDNILVQAVAFDETIEVCKGLYWRGSVSHYVSSHNSIEKRESLRLLKRMSCPGCQYCWWILESNKESLPAIPDIKHGQLYTFFAHTSKDWESGHTELDYIEIVEAIE